MDENKNVVNEKNIMGNEIEKIKLKDLIDICKNFNNKTIGPEELIDFINNKIFVGKYIPLEKKCEIVEGLFFDNINTDLNDLIGTGKEISKFKFFNIMLSYTNLIVDEDDYTDENYDLLVPIIYDMIYPIIFNDFTRFNDMINDIKNFENILGILDYVSDGIVSGTDINKELADTFKELKNNEDILGKALELMKYNNE